MADTYEMIFVGPARVSFPNFWGFQERGGQKYKPGCSLLLTKGSADAKTVQQAIDAIQKEKKFSLRKDRLCLTDGDDSGRPEYAGHWVLKTNAQKPAGSTGGIAVLNARAEHVASQNDDPIYSGCFVKAKVRLWAQDNEWGKRVNCELVGIQFIKDGEAFDGSFVPDDERVEGFGAVEDGAEDTPAPAAKGKAKAKPKADDEGESAGWND